MFPLLPNLPKSKQEIQFSKNRLNEKKDEQVEKEKKWSTILLLQSSLKLKAKKMFRQKTTNLLIFFHPRVLCEQQRRRRRRSRYITNLLEKLINLPHRNKTINQVRDKKNTALPKTFFIRHHTKLMFVNLNDFYATEDLFHVNNGKICT